MPDTSAIIPYDQVAAGAGELVTGLNKGVLEATKSVVCPLYKNFPGFATGANFGNPFADASDALLQQTCNTPTNPPPARIPPSFTGGNCAGQNYIVNYNFNTGQGEFSSSINITGPVRGISRENITNAQGQPAVNVFLLGGPAVPGGVPDRAVLTGNASPSSTFTITSVALANGQPDNCGNRPSGFPINTPADIDLNLNVPVTLAPNLTVNAPVSIYAPINTLAPSLRLGDLNVDFNLGGLTISPALNVNITPPGATPPAPARPPAGNTPQDRDYTELLNLLVRYAKRARDCQECDDDFTFTTSGIAGGSSGRIAVPSGSTLVAAALTIVTRPTNFKFQPGRGQADVLYAGWGWFDGNLNQAERLPVDAEDKLFYAPKKPSPTGFSFTLYTGFTGQAVITYKTPINPKSAP